MMALFVYLLGNTLYLGLQFIVYLGYKLDAYLDAQSLDHDVHVTLGTTLLTTATTTVLIGVVALLLAPVLPHAVQQDSTQP